MSYNVLTFFFVLHKGGELASRTLIPTRPPCPDGGTSSAATSSVSTGDGTAILNG